MVKKREQSIVGPAGHIIWNPYLKKGKRKWMLSDNMGSITRWSK